MISGLYLHIPFCKSRCSYCDFYTAACKDDELSFDRYVESLSLALKRLSRAGLLAELETVYVGGGTPSYLQSKLTMLLYNLSLLIHVDRLKEFTVECNPESFTPALFKDLRALGVTRYSFGVQSFDDKELRLLGRAHSSKEVHEALEFLSAEGAEVSIDLICGLPNQSLEDFKRSLETALSYPLNHISIYPLSIEEGTLLGRQIEEGRLPEPDEDTQVEILLYAQERLEQAGYVHYEISNYAKAGHESQHNSSYWKAHEYLGLGPHASSMINAQDFKELAQCLNLSLELPEDLGSQELSDLLACPDLERFRFECLESTQSFMEALQVKSLSNSALSKGACTRQTPASLRIACEGLDAQECFVEDLMLSLRLLKGFNYKMKLAELDQLVDRAKLTKDCAQAIKACLEFYIKQGQLQLKGDQLSFTSTSWLLGNEIFASIWDCAYLGKE